MPVSAYARHRGVSRAAVLKAIKTGRITREADGGINPAKADMEWARNTDPALQRKAVKQSGPPCFEDEAPGDPRIVEGVPSFARSRAIREAYNARLAKLEYEEKSGELVRVADVKSAWFGISRLLRDRILALPDRLAPLLAPETNQKAIREMLDAELRAVLESAADGIEGINIH